MERIKRHIVLFLHHLVAPETGIGLVFKKITLLPGSVFLFWLGFSPFIESHGDLYSSGLEMDWWWRCEISQLGLKRTWTTPIWWQTKMRRIWSWRIMECWEMWKIASFYVPGRYNNVGRPLFIILNPKKLRYHVQWKNVLVFQRLKDRLVGMFIKARFLSDD